MSEKDKNDPVTEILMNTILIEEKLSMKTREQASKPLYLTRYE